MEFKTRILYYVKYPGTDNFYSREITVYEEDGKTAYEFTDSEDLIHTYKSHQSLMSALASDVRSGRDKWLPMDNTLGVEVITSTIDSLKHRIGLLEKLLEKEFKHRLVYEDKSAPESRPSEVTRIFNRMELGIYYGQLHDKVKLREIMDTDMRILKNYIINFLEGSDI